MVTVIHERRENRICALTTGVRAFFEGEPTGERDPDERRDRFLNWVGEEKESVVGEYCIGNF